MRLSDHYEPSEKEGRKSVKCSWGTRRRGYTVITGGGGGGGRVYKFRGVLGGVA